MVQQKYSSLKFTTMRLVFLLCLISLAVSTAITEASSSTNLDDDGEDSEVFHSDYSDDSSDAEREEQLRIKRSPLWKRKRFRFRESFRKVGQAIKRKFSKAGQAIKKIGRKLKEGTKKAISKTKSFFKKAGNKMKSGLKKAHGKTKSAFRKLKEKVGKIKRFPKNFFSKIKEKIRKIICKNEKKVKESKNKEIPVSPVRPSCDETCEFLKQMKKRAEFFKKSFCAFYSTKIVHTDFLLDRNVNGTLAMMINDLVLDSIGFFTEVSEVIKALEPKMAVVAKKAVVARRQMLSTDCMKGKIMPCKRVRTSLKDIMHKLKCVRPCHGFFGCDTNDSALVELIEGAAEKFQKEIGRTLKLLE